MPLDPVASLMLEEAGQLPERVLVVDDVDAALTHAVVQAGSQVRAWCDDARELAAIPPALRYHTSARWAPQLVLWRLPRAVSAVEDYAENLARQLDASARVVAGGRVKHMALAQTEALRRHFGDVSASLGRQKCRVLRAANPAPAPARWPARRYLPEIGLTVIAHGSVFNTVRLDDGTRLLLRTLEHLGCPSDPATGAPRAALDFGSGSGIIASWLARRGWRTSAVDVSAAAAASTRATAQANRAYVTTTQADGLVEVEPLSLDLIATNPPFHRGAAKDTTATLAMFAQAAAVLRPGGELWAVFNSHLPYLAALRRHIGPTTIEAQDRHYIVSRSLKQAA